MNKLTDEEIKKYIKTANKNTGVKAITEKDLKNIDLDEVPEIIFPDVLVDGSIITDLNGVQRFKYDSFIPRVGSIYFKPSFAGRQVLMGRVGRKLYFSDGRWFV